MICLNDRSRTELGSAPFERARNCRNPSRPNSSPEELRASVNRIRVQKQPIAASKQGRGIFVGSIWKRAQKEAVRVLRLSTTDQSYDPCVE